jgi:hypothetical protein
MTAFLKTNTCPSRSTSGIGSCLSERTICYLCKTVDHNRNGPEEIHALGLKVSGRLNAEMEK